MAVAVEEATEVKAEPEVREAVEAPVLNLGEAIEIYFHMQHQARDLDQTIRVLRDQILEAMREQHVNAVEHGGYKIVRQTRHYLPKLNLEAAEKLLKRFHRLEEATVERIDETKARQALEDLSTRGLISREEIPYVKARPSEVLIVRPVEAKK